MPSRTNRIVCLAVPIFVAALFSEAQAINVVRFDSLGTFTTASLNEGGVFVTGSAGINVLNNNGLGILGGLADSLVDSDGSESIRFDFIGGPATSVSYRQNIIPAGQAVDVEAFSTDGQSLGTVVHGETPSNDVSADFGGQPIAAFRMVPTAESIRVNWIIFVPAPLGDMTGDGMVGPNDYTEWANTFGEEFDFINSLPADVNGDFMVGPEDYTLWANNFGASQSGPVAVPEPSGIALICIGLLLAAQMARRC